MKSDEMAAKLQWLVDRADLDELVAAYARAIDTRDFHGWQALFTEDGGYGNPPHRVPRALMVEAAARMLEPFPGTQHILGQHSIRIEGDEATGRCYFLGVHVDSALPSARRADVGGWYENSYRRTSEGWRIVSAGGEVVWTAGENYFAHAAPIIEALLASSQGAAKVQGAKLPG